jgi:hypothetical protein
MPSFSFKFKTGRKCNSQRRRERNRLLIVTLQSQKTRQYNLVNPQFNGGILYGVCRFIITNNTPKDLILLSSIHLLCQYQHRKF